MSVDELQNACFTLLKACNHCSDDDQHDRENCDIRKFFLRHFEPDITRDGAICEYGLPLDGLLKE